MEAQRLINIHAAALFSDRIVVILRVEEREIVLLDIGTHDEVYRG